MVIERNKYLQRIIAHKWNGKVKIITGISRCGKSFLLFELYKQHLLESGIKDDHIIEVALDRKEDAYLFKQAKRYDVKGRKYYGSPLKYYATDLGLRNAKLNFRQQERSHLMENIIFNELILRGYAVDVGVVELTTKNENGKPVQSQYEIDFIVNTGRQKIYIQSALNVDTPEKKDQETCSLKNSGDFFRKIVVLDGNQKLWTDDDGISYVGVIPFLIDENIL